MVLGFWELLEQVGSLLNCFIQKAQNGRQMQASCDSLIISILLHGGGPVLQNLERTRGIYKVLDLSYGEHCKPDHATGGKGQLVGTKWQERRDLTAIL